MYTCKHTNANAQMHTYTYTNTHMHTHTHTHTHTIQNECYTTQQHTHDLNIKYVREKGPPNWFFSVYARKEGEFGI